MASSECPPEAKKSSSSPGSPPPNARAQAAATARSTALPGGRRSVAIRPPVARNAAMSTFPAAVSGSSSVRTARTGIMYSGRRSAQYERSSSSPGAVPGVR
jgi:hypothetical protein